MRDAERLTSAPPLRGIARLLDRSASAVAFGVALTLFIALLLRVG
ncbi:hypothetical protein [Methyloversatilis sp. NSM2]